MAEEIFAKIDDDRRGHGFRNLAETMELAETNTIFDPFSTLIARDADIGSGNLFYPGVVVRLDGGACVIGDKNMFWPSTIIIAARDGRIRIGDGCSFGPGGARVLAYHPGAELRIDDRVRVLNGAEIVDSCHLGIGSQVLGAISARAVDLGGGGDFTEPNPDRRGAVLKGFGLARGTRLSIGEVMNGEGDFTDAEIERQLAYHPRSGG
jgi:hypothetical protein